MKHKNDLASPMIDLMLDKRNITDNKEFFYCLESNEFLCTPTMKSFAGTF